MTEDSLIEALASAARKAVDGTGKSPKGWEFDDARVFLAMMKAYEDAKPRHLWADEPSTSGKSHKFEA